MNYKEISLKICNFYENEVLNKMQGLDKYLGYAGMFLANNQIDTVFNKLKDNKAIQMFGVINGEDIDVDKLHQAFKFAIEKTGTVELFGMKMNATGIETLFKYIK